MNDADVSWRIMDSFIISALVIANTGAVLLILVSFIFDEVRNI